MNKNLKTDTIDVVILCGGKGERLRPAINDRPKPLAEIGGRPFLDILIDYVASFGFRRFILCIGYMRDMIKQRYQNHKKGNLSLNILFSEEKELLGTAGAVKNAEPLIQSNPFLVMNGDSFCRLDLNKFVDFHSHKKALISIAVAKIEKRNDYGFVTLKDSQRIATFNEKVRWTKDSFVSTGVYFFQDKALSLLPAGKNYSLEKEFFPAIIDKQFYGFITQETFIDIGTPERYREVNQASELKNNFV